MNTLRWTLVFFVAAGLAAIPAFALPFSPAAEWVSGAARFLFFLCASVFLVLALTHLFFGSDIPEQPRHGHG